MRAVFVSYAAAQPANRGKLRALGGLGCTVAVAVPDRWAGAPAGAVQHTDWSDDGGVRVVPIPVRGAADEPPALRWNRRELRRLLADFRPDVLQIEETPGSYAAAAAAAAGRRLGIRVVLLATESVRQSYTLGERLRRARVLRSAAGIIGINRLALGLLTRVRPEVPHAVIPQLGVVPPGRVDRVPHDGLAIGFVGRLVPERGVDTLLRASVRLAGPWTLTVAGTGPAQEELEALAERLGIAARIRWLGGVPRRDLDAIWPTLDCVVLPARTTQRWVEPVGQPLLDAMGHGIAVVASTSGALPDVIGDAGHLVAEDDPAALSDVLQRLADDPAARERLGADGRRRVIGNFSESAVARDTMEFWQRLPK